MESVENREKEISSSMIQNFQMIFPEKNNDLENKPSPIYTKGESFQMIIPTGHSPVYARGVGG